MSNNVVEQGKYRAFTHKECEFYPCHKLEEGQELNCLFCYCPFYFREEPCPQDFTGGQVRAWYNQKGERVKDCTNCTWIHDERNYTEIISALSSIIRGRDK